MIKIEAHKRSGIKRGLVNAVNSRGYGFFRGGVGVAVVILVYPLLIHGAGGVEVQGVRDQEKH